MEHRYSERVTVDVQALIYKSGLPIAIGRARNLSRHGIFLDCGTAGIGVHQTVEIELFLQGKKAEKIGRFKCQVARTEAHGVALSIFDDCQPL